MWLIQRWKFKWREPDAFVAIRDAQEAARYRWWHGVLATAVSALLLMFVWYLATKNPENTPPSFEAAILLSIVAGLFYGYGARRLNRWSSSKIKVGTKTLLLQRGSCQSIAWTNVSTFRFDQLEDMHVLQLALRKGRSLAVGLHESVNREHLEQFLRSLGIRCEDDDAAI